MNRFKRTLFGLGGAAENFFQNAPMAMVSPIFNVGLGISPVVIGIAMALPRFWEIILDPWIGVVSDRTQSSLGRRRPYIYGGSILAGLLFAMIWWVPRGWNATYQSAWLVGLILLFYTAYSFFAVPYAAFAIEVTTNNAERMQVMAVRTALASFSSILIGWLYWLCQRSCFSDPVYGMRYIGIGMGVLLGVAAFMPAWIARENPMHVGTGHAPEMKLNWEFARQIVGVKSFRLLLCSLFVLLVGFTLVGHLGFYLVVYYICQGNKDFAAWIGGINATLGTIVSMLACPLVAATANRIGKRNALALYLGIGCAGSASYWWTMTPEHPYLFIVSGIGICFGLAAYWSIMPALLGDISDAFETKTGLACQGVFSALYGIAVKIGVSVSLLLTGYILIACGFDVSQTVEQMVNPLFYMRILYAVFPLLGMVLATWIIWHIKINDCGSSTSYRNEVDSERNVAN